MIKTTVAPVHISNVCRVAISAEIAALADRAGVIPLSVALLPARQITMAEDYRKPIMATLQFHRDTWVPTVYRAFAARKVSQGQGEYAAQSLLVFPLADYLSDNDVLADPGEHKKASESGAEFVIVAVIGEARSAVAVCRNVVSGCQNMAGLVQDCENAVKASRTFLIADDPA